eukprot:GABV01002773.1.p1 GENE.GABV01002773.1~~GABV01002773.1.p1  ORF type:complete len:214 (+),score=96.72 GABV01002773.1:26-643(+)
MEELEIRTKSNLAKEREISLHLTTEIMSDELQHRDKAIARLRAEVTQLSSSSASPKESSTEKASSSSAAAVVVAEEPSPPKEADHAMPDAALPPSSPGVEFKAPVELPSPDVVEPMDETESALPAAAQVEAPPPPAVVESPSPSRSPKLVAKEQSKEPSSPLPVAAAAAVADDESSPRASPPSCPDGLSGKDVVALREFSLRLKP